MKNHPDDTTRQWVAKSGISVHFKTPINGNPNNGYVQTDLMFGNPEAMKFAFKGTGDGTVYKGAHRAIMIASMAKARGMKWSPGKGLLDRETNDLVASAPDEVAVALLGQGANRADMDSVEKIVKKIRNSPDYDALTADAFANFEKQGLPLPESRGMITGMIQAKQRVDEKNMFGKALNTFGAGFKVAQGGPQSFSKMKKIYKDAGGGKTTFGQVSDIGTRVGQRITGDTVTVKGQKQGKQVFKTIAATDIEKYTKANWKVVPKNAIIIYHPNDPKREKQISKKDYAGKGWDKSGWVIKNESQNNESIVREASRIDMQKI